MFHTIVAEAATRRRHGPGDRGTSEARYPIEAGSVDGRSSGGTLVRLPLLAMNAHGEHEPSGGEPRGRSITGIVATSVLLAMLGVASFIGLRRAIGISLPADLACAVISLGLLVWVGADFRRRLVGRHERPPGRLHRWFSLRPGVCAWALLLPIAGWYALRIPGPMGHGPVAIPFDRAPWSSGAWRTGPVVVVSLGDSVSTGYGAPPGHGYVDLVVRNDVARYPDVGGADLSHVLPKLTRMKFATLSSNSIDHEKSVAFIPVQSPDTHGIVFLTTGGIDLIHPYGHDTPREGAMYGATLAEARPWIERFTARLERTLMAIASRFPGGCDVFVGTIYDPTDGVGDIENAGVIFWLPAWPDALAIHARFNRAIRDACSRHPFAHVVDIHGALLGHGIHCRDTANPHYQRDDPTYWYFFNLEDPNERGYDAIRRVFLAELGTVLPARFAALAPRSSAAPR